MRHSTQTPTLAEAARALVYLDERGQLPTLKDNLILARRDWQKLHERRTIGEPLYVKEIGDWLQADGISAAEALAAAQDAIRPRWCNVLLRTICDFANEVHQCERRSA